MTMKKILLSCVVVSGSLLASSAFAKTTAEEAAQLGGDKLTCVGAERAANADGSIPAFSGKWQGAWSDAAKGSTYDPGPYAAEKPLFIITEQNVEQYAARLTEGQKALLKRYPKTFRVPVYPSHRDFRYPDWVCDTIKKNATTADVVSNGLGITGTTGATPFPFPKAGIEAQWNMQYPHRAWTEESTQDQAVVYANGSKTFGRVYYRIYSPWNNPHQRGSNQDKINSYFNVLTLLPERDKGSIYTGWTPNDDTLDRQTWFYSPGTRRVRQAPEFGFDTPQGAGGFRTVDDDRLFNGSPERYDWKLVGKQEIYIPYNTYKMNDPALKYSDMLTPNSLNPDLMRYELHRVWVLEATVKKGYRHVYAKRRFYLDEDSWHAVWVDNYDSRGQLWRASMVNYFWSPAIQGFQAGIALFHDLNADVYFADRMVNESKTGWKLNAGDLTADMFAPDAAQRSGH